VADVNGDGKAEIVGFGNEGVLVSLRSAEGYDRATYWSADFGAGASAGGWNSQNVYPRLLADVNGDGKADIVGFGSAGVYVALSTGSGFRSSARWSPSFGASPSAGGWSSQNVYPRLLADVNGDGRADIVGFGNAGVYVALSSGNAFYPMTRWSAQCGAGSAAGSWTNQDLYPRMLADVDGDGKADILGYGSAGAYYALSNATSFGPLTQGASFFGSSPEAGGWISQNQYPRMAADVNGDHQADLIGFGGSGVWVAPHN
jgi:hypothetical protein